MEMLHPGVAAIGGDAEVDHAIATLVLAFATDPVARWMYGDPHQYLLHLPRLFRALGKPSFEAGAAQRTEDGIGVALWLPPRVHGDDGPLEAVIAESVVEEKQAEVAAAFEQTEHYRPAAPHWYLSLIGVEALHRNKGRGAALLEHRLRRCDREHLPAYLCPRTHLIPLFTRGMASRSRARFEWVRLLRSIPRCATRAEKSAHASTSQPFAERTSNEKFHARTAYNAGYLAAAHLCGIRAERCRRGARYNDRKAHVLLMGSGVVRAGRAAVREFYADKFIPNIPPDFEMTTVSQTFGDDRIVEEMAVPFTHSIDLDWLLPEVRPTGRKAEFIVAAFIQFAGGKIAHEHAY